MPPSAFARTSLLLASWLLALGAGAAFAQDFEPPRVLSDSVVPSDSGWDEFPDVATDGAGNWVAVWQSDENLAGAIGTDGDILVARSSDDGATWSAPAVLNSNAAVDEEPDERPRIVTDRAGTWIATWTSREFAPDPTLDGDSLYSRSTDNGATWSAVGAINSGAATDSSSDDRAELATDGAGNWVAIWESVDYSVSNELDLFVSRSSNGGVTWTAKTLLHPSLSSDMTDDDAPDLATDGSGQWIAVWHKYTLSEDTDVFVSRSTNAGASWSAPVPLASNAATDEGDDVRPNLATSGGTWVVAWTTTDTLGDTIDWDRDILFSRSTDAGATWSPVATVASDATTDYTHDDFLSITEDGSGNWAIAWRSTSANEDAEVRVARSTNNGVSWLPTEFLNTNFAEDDGWDGFPRVVADGDGTWLAVWGSSSSLDETIGSDDDILFARSLDAAATWSAPAPLNINATDDRGGDDSPRISMSSTGRGIAVWSSNDDLGAGGDLDLDILFSATTDGGVTWSAPSSVRTDSTTDDAWDRAPDVANDGAGTWMVVWSSQADSVSSLVVAVSHDDGATWSAPQPIREDAEAPRLATDGAGTWVVVSSKSEGGVSSDTSTDGGATWQGTLLPGATGGSNAAVATDSAGTWLAVWNGNWSFPDEVFAATSTNEGNTWSTPVRVDSGSLDARTHEPAVATDSAGTWVVSWSAENAGNDTQVRFARSFDAGETWSAMGNLNSLAVEGSGTDSSPEILTDAAGTWLAVWEKRTEDLPDEPDLVVARSTDYAATWSAPVLLNTNGDDDEGQDVDSALATDRNGNWVAVWSSTGRLGGEAGSRVPDIFVSVGGVCGDGALGANETCTEDLCNDGNPCTLDSWEAGPGCLHEPAFVDPPSCLAAPQTSVRIRSSDEPGRDSLSWSWKNGEGFAQSDLGGPLLPGYALCVYDMTGSTPSLATSLVFSRDGKLWKNRSPRGLQYKSRDGEPGGVTKASIKTGDDSRTKITLKAGGAFLALPPAAGSTYFVQDPEVVVQLVHAGGACWTSAFAVDVTSDNEESGFSAKTR